MTDTATLTTDPRVVDGICGATTELGDPPKPFVCVIDPHDTVAFMPPHVLRNPHPPGDQHFFVHRYLEDGLESPDSCVATDRGSAVT